jgi:Tfp pilus assembly protein PilF
MKRQALTSGVIALTVAGLLWPATALGAKTINWDKKLEHGYQQLSIGNVDEAINIFSSKVKSYPQSGACHTALGKALKKKGKLGQAKAEFRQATSVEPNFADAYYEVAAMEESDKEYQQAATDFDKYLSLNPQTDRKAVADRIRFCQEQK